MKSSIALVLLFSLARATIAQEGAGHLANETEILAEIEALKEQVGLLQRQLAPPDSAAGGDAVDLSGEELPSLYEEVAATHVLARPWYQNIDISGFGAVWLVDSGKDGTRPHPGFVIKESSLFVEAEAWEEVSFFFEIQTNGLQRDHSASVRTGEVYAHFRNVLKKWGDDLLGLKVGRVDIPFGEEYLWQDAPDNPLISNSAAYPWLWDEGIVLYGRFRGIGWVASVMDGTLARSQEDGPDKAVIAKVYGKPREPLYLSASLMRNGDTTRGALLLGGSLFQPVGAGGASSVGSSPSEKVDALLGEVDAKYRISEKAALELSLGRALVNDQEDAFDRDLTWFLMQPRYNFTENVHAVLRYSEIGTYDSGQGYRIGGEFLAGGNEAFGYDARRLQRFAAGLGWRLNFHTMVKLEVGRDWFEVIDSSPFDPGGDDRKVFALELAVSF